MRARRSKAGARAGRVREAQGTVRLDRRADDAHILGVVVGRVGAAQAEPRARCTRRTPAGAVAPSVRGIAGTLRRVRRRQGEQDELEQRPPPMGAGRRLQLEQPPEQRRLAKRREGARRPARAGRGEQRVKRRAECSRSRAPPR